MRRHTLALAIVAALVSSASLAATTDPQALLIEQGYYWQSKKTRNGPPSPGRSCWA